MTPTITSRKRLLNRFQRTQSRERFVADDKGKRPTTAADRLILALGEPQDSVYYEMGNRIAGYGRSGREEAVVLDHFDVQGVLSGSLIDVGDSLILLSGNGMPMGISQATAEDTILYLSPTGKLVGAARRLNEFFVEYLDPEGRRIDIALCGVNKVSVLNEGGTPKRQVCTSTFDPQWVALEDAWRLVPSLIDPEGRRAS